MKIYQLLLFALMTFSLSADEVTKITLDQLIKMNVSEVPEKIQVTNMTDPRSRILLGCSYPSVGKTAGLATYRQD